MFVFCIKLLYWRKKIWISFYFDSFLASDGIPALLICTLFYFFKFSGFRVFSGEVGCFSKCHFSRYSLVSVFLTGPGSVSSPSQVDCLKASYPLSLFLLFPVLTFVHALVISLKPAKRALLCSQMCEVWTNSFAIGAASQSRHVFNSTKSALLQHPYSVSHLWTPRPRIQWHELMCHLP